MFKRLLEFDTVRGPHSTGVLFVNSGGDAEVVKRVGTPWEFYQYKAVEDKFRNFHCVMMGHNRWATQGKINNANAHPFEIDTIIGAHNGTLTSRYMLDDYTKFDVDSENLYHHMENNGVHDTIENLNGAFALTWWDKKDRTLNFVRNDQRPLYYAYSDDRKALFWASEPWMLAIASQHCGVKLLKIEELPVALHLKFYIPLKVLANAEEIGNPVATKVKLYTPKVYVSPNNSGSVAPFPTKPALVSPRPASNIKGNGNVSTVREVLKAGNASFMEYNRCVGKKMTFTVFGDAVANNQKYIQCYSVDDDRISIRCYPGEGTPLWKKLLGSTMVFKGTIKAFNSTGGMHLTVDLRSVEEDKEATDELNSDVPVLVLGYKDELLTHEEYEKATEKGCAWCQQHATLEEAEDIVFIASDEFICPDCKEFTDVQDYLKQAKGN